MLLTRSEMGIPNVRWWQRIEPNKVDVRGKHVMHKEIEVIC